MINPSSDFEKKVETQLGPMLRSAGLETVESLYSAQSFGNACVTMKTGQMAVRFVRETGRVWIDLAKGLEGPWWGIDDLATAAQGLTATFQVVDPEQLILKVVIARFIDDFATVVDFINDFENEDLARRMHQLGFRQRY